MKIPFFNNIHPVHLIVSFLALSRPNHVQAACPLPEGDFQASCSDIGSVPYESSDPNVPTMCEFTASCKTIFEGLKPAAVKAYLPAGVLFEEIQNNNGTLVYQNKPFAARPGSTTVKAAAGSCQSPSGSYGATCVTQVREYSSSDSNLGSAPLCQAEMQCDTLTTGISKSSFVYFNVKKQQGTVQRIENCDGKLVLGQNDARCKDKEPEIIQKISSEKGSNTLTLG